MRRNTASRLRVPRSRTSMYAPIGILTAACLARISVFTTGYVRLWWSFSLREKWSWLCQWSYAYGVVKFFAFRKKLLLYLKTATTCHQANFTRLRTSLWLRHNITSPKGGILLPLSPHTTIVEGRGCGISVKKTVRLKRLGNSLRKQVVSAITCSTTTF